MHKLVFYDKEIRPNNPNYALKLLHSLSLSNIEVLVIGGGGLSYENETGTTLKQIYSEYDFTQVSQISDLGSFIEEKNPDIFLTSFNYNDFSIKIQKFFYENNVKVIELDLIASEVMLYNFDWVINQPPMNLRWRIKSILTKLYNYIVPRNISLPLLNYFRVTPREIFTDYLFVKGKWFKEFILKDSNFQLNENKIKITGSPQLDNITNANKSKDFLFDKYNLDKDRKLVIFCPPKEGFGSYSDINFIHESIKAISSEVDINIAIKPHPNNKSLKEDTFYHKNIISPLDFYDLLNHSSAIITCFSSIGIEASLAQTPLIVRYKNKDIIDLPYFGSQKSSRYPKGVQSRYNIGLLSSSKDIVINLKKILANEITFNFDKFNRDLSDNSSLNSYQKVTNEICKILKE